MAMPADVPANLTQHPDTRIVHGNNGGNTLRGRKAEHAYRPGSSDTVTIEGDNAEAVPGERDPVSLSGAGVEKMEHNALALPNSHRLTRAHDLPVDGGDGISGIHGAVVAGQQAAIPVMEAQKKLLIVTRRIVATLYHQHAVLTAVLSSREIPHCHGVGVIPAESSRTRREGVPYSRTWSDRWSALFHGAVDGGWQKETVPVNNLRAIATVSDLDGRGPPLFQAQ